MGAGPHDHGVVGLHGDHQIRERVVLLHIAEALIGEGVVVPAEARAGLPPELLHRLAHLENPSAVVGRIGTEHAQRSIENGRWLVRDRQAGVHRVPVDVDARVAVLEQIDQ